MAWFSRKDKNISADATKKDIPSGLWTKCPSCSEIQYKPELEKNYFVCRQCSHHFRMTPDIYFDLLIDEKSSKEIFNNIKSYDVLDLKPTKVRIGVCSSSIYVQLILSLLFIIYHL